MGRNAVHGSDSVESAKREIALWFGPGELTNSTNHSESWVYENVLSDSVKPSTQKPVQGSSGKPTA